MASNTAKRRKLKAGRNRELILRRINAGLSPNLLAQRAGISGSTVRNAEAGYYVEADAQRAICDALSVEDVCDLFPWERQRESQGRR